MGQSLVKKSIGNNLDTDHEYWTKNKVNTSDKLKEKHCALETRKHRGKQNKEPYRLAGSKSDG